MAMQLYDAAVEGNNISLRNLLQQDQLLLDRFVTGCYRETPLHVAAMLGHFEFVDEVVTRKPELARELNSQKSSALHLATTKGYLEIVKRLLQVNPDMCHACDIHGRNPLHIAAMKGHLDVLKELVHAEPWAARSLMEDGKTILHACVRCKQLELLKFLVETIVSDHDFVNYQNCGGDTILHLAISTNQTEAISFLISWKTVDVNRQNVDGITALDLLSQNAASDVKEKEIVNNRNVGWLKKLLNWVTKEKEKEDIGVWVEKQQNTLMLVATVLAAMAFQAGINPPSGIWQENGPSGNSTTTANGKIHTAGWSIFADNHPILYTLFVVSNTTAFMSSLSVILLLMSGLPLKNRFFVWILMAAMLVAIIAMGAAYIQSLVAFTPDETFSVLIYLLNIVSKVWCGLMLLLLVGHTIRLIKRSIKFLWKSVTGLKKCRLTRCRGRA